ncbi:MAG: hypothetical protein JXB17_02505 [Bacteroidales bacterium]|nr:hypothetical protein [Bacteroidales bacterium]
MRNFLILGILSLIGINLTGQATIDNVRIFHDENYIYVYYDFNNIKSDQAYFVSLYMSTDGGKTFLGPLKAVSGDVGKVIGGKYKKITWDVLKDVPYLEGNIVFDVRAVLIDKTGKPQIGLVDKQAVVPAKTEREKPAQKNVLFTRRRFYLSYNGTINAPIGFQFGQIGKVSWYISGRANPDVEYYETSYDCNGDEVFNYNGNGYYVFANKVIKPRWSATGGLNLQVSRNFFLYAGGGYGEKKIFWRIDEYNYNGNWLNYTYVRSRDYSYYGAEIEVGMILRMAKRLLISVGFSNLDFNKNLTSTTFGIGYNF